MLCLNGQYEHSLPRKAGALFMNLDFMAGESNSLLSRRAVWRDCLVAEKEGDSVVGMQEGCEKRHLWY
jgi:gamma-glutamylcysteine synthetase